jgi:hypothetical protein
MRPAENEFAPFYQKYVALVPESDVIAALEAQADTLAKLRSNAAAKETFAYEPGKWTVREVVGHVCDVERVFGFRAFTFSRQDRNALPGFDQDTYVNESRYLDVPLADLVEDFALIRRANVRVLRRLRDEQWLMSGTANGKVITVRALAFVMVGHVRHHLQILRDRYDVGT